MSGLSWDRDVLGASSAACRRVLGKDAIPLYLVVFIVGIVAGIGAIVFRVAIWLFQIVLFGPVLNPGSVEFSMVKLPAVLGGASLAGVPDLFSAFAALGVWRFVLIPAVGGLLVGLYIYATSPEVEGHGTDRTLEALLVRGGRIEPSIAGHKIVASSIAIASGASLGREGPIVQIGSAVGAFFSRFVNNRYRRILVAAGAGAGIAGTFNAPLAGMLFAVEVLLVEYDIRSLIAIGIACAMAVVVVRPVLPFTSTLGNALFMPTQPLHVVDPIVEYPLYIVLGLLVAVVGSFEVSALYGVGDYFEGIDIPRYYKPAIGGGLLGLTILLAAWLSQFDGGALSSQQSANWLFGVGYNTIHAVIAQNQFALEILLLFAVMKIAGFALSIGSGSSGGVFSPSLFIGAMVGGAFGLAVQGIPGTAAPAAYALVGMGGVFAAAARAPLTALLITVELSGQYTLILPLLLVCVMGSELTDTFVSQGSIYTEALNRMGYDIQNRRIGSIEDYTPTDLMTMDVETVTPDDPITLAIERLADAAVRALPVVTAGKVVGIVTVSDISTLANEELSEALSSMALDGGQSIEQDLDGKTVEDIATGDVVTIAADSNLLEGVHKMKTMDVRQLPVVDEDGTLLGLLTESDILNAYDRSILR